MPNTYACKLVSNPNVPIFLPRVCTLVLFIFKCFFGLVCKGAPETVGHILSSCVLLQ